MSRPAAVLASLVAVVLTATAVGAAPAAAAPATADTHARTAHNGTHKPPHKPPHKSLHKAPHNAPRRAPTAAPPAAGSFVPVGAFRALDQRASAAIRAGHRVTVPMTGRHGIPANAAAVAVTVHAVDPRSSGTLTLFPAGTAAPATTNLSYTRGQTAAQAAVVRLAHGGLTIVDRARSGSVRLALDVSGYFAGGAVDTASPGLLHVLSSPVRALDTRHPGGYFRAHSVRSLRVGHGVPNRGVGAVAVMLTANDPARAGSLVAYAMGNDQPTVPTTRFGPDRTTTAFAWVPTHSDGSISIANNSGGATGVLLDVVGWANAGVARTAGAFQPRFPDRVVSGARLGAGQTRTVHIAGQAGVPLARVSAVLASITASGATRGGALEVGNTGTNPTARRAVEFSSGTKPADLVELPLVNGALPIHNTSRGPVTIAVDVVGFVPSVTLAPPAMSISRYLGDLTEDVGTDRTIMDRRGCDDATAMSGVSHPFVLLDVGAQSVTGPELSPTNAGVSLTEVPAGTTVRLDYGDLRTVLESYLAAFSRCAPRKSATIAIGTSNDGDYSSTDPYKPEARGADWAGSVINLLGSETGLTIVGANDIEPDFASTQGQAQRWVNAYLRAASTKTLIFNGSADGCPDGFGATDAACSSGFTQQGIYNLAHNASGQIDVVPQVYSPSMAAQWANIDKTGGGQLSFAGALTEHQMNADTYTSANGWAALSYAVGSLTRTPRIAAASDITNG